jgi:hypothetical protein
LIDEILAKIANLKLAESLASGFQAANYKAVVVPYREFSQSSVTEAATSVIRGILSSWLCHLRGQNNLFRMLCSGLEIAFDRIFQRERMQA